MIIVGPLSSAEVGAAALASGASTLIHSTSKPPRLWTGVLPRSCDVNSESPIALLLEPSAPISESIECCRQLSAKYALIDYRMTGAKELCEALAAEASRAVLVGRCLDYDEDPQWVAEGFRECVQDWKVDTFVLSVLPSITEPVDWLDREAGRHPEDPTWADIESLATTFRIFLDISHSNPARVDRWRKMVPSAQGFIVFVGDPEHVCPSDCRGSERRS